MNELQFDDVQKLRKFVIGAHYVNLVVRKNGNNTVFEADWLKEVLDFYIDKNIEQLSK